MTGKNSTVFYLTGLGGTLNKGLGQALSDLEVAYSGISYSGSFESLSHIDKLALVKSKLSEFIEMGGNKLVAVSAGGLLIVELLEEHMHRDEVKQSKSKVINPFLKKILANDVTEKPESEITIETIVKVDFSKIEILLLSPILPYNPTIVNQPKSLRVIFGSEDYLYSEFKTNNLLNSIPNSSLLLSDGAGHSLPHDCVRSELISLIS